MVGGGAAREGERLAEVGGDLLLGDDVPMCVPNSAG